jgi:hypothetical protein
LDLTYLYSWAETLPGSLSKPPAVVRRDPIRSSLFHNYISYTIVQMSEWILSCHSERLGTITGGLCR